MRLVHTGFSKQNIKHHYDVDAATGCWNWKKSLTRKGYGHKKLQYKNVLAHRLSYELHKGDIPPGMQVLHSCDNRRCINPDHLRVGTQSENILEAVRKGRFHPPRHKGQANPFRKLTEQQVIQFRNMHQKGMLDVESDAMKYGVKPMAIRRAASGKSWRHLSLNEEVA